MRASRKIVSRVILGAACLQLVASAQLWAGTVPVADSFESYSPGDQITDEDDWSGASVDAGVVSTNVAAITALAAYTNASGTFPLPLETHTQVLELSNPLTNTVASATGGVVIAEWLAMPALRDAATEGSTNHQFAFYVNTNSNVVIWRRDTLPTPTNDWLTLTGGPTIDASKWMRVKVTLDYVTDRFQLAIDGTAIIDDEGEKRNGSATGSWFHMVQTNSYMSRFHTGGEELAYLDDLVFTNRSVSYSGTTFAEAAGNNGSIATTNTITLVGDTFVSPLTDSHYTTSGVPAGLSVLLERVDDTTATIALSGNATAHSDDAAMTLEFLDGAFVYGAADNVEGYTNAFTIDFHDGVGMFWSTTTFDEAAANDGSIDDSITITLAGDTFVTGTYNLNDEYEITSGTVPAGLTLSVAYLNATHVTVSLDDTADSHDGGGGAFTLAFKDAAFTGGSASGLPNTSQALTVSLLAKPVLTYSGTAFAEVSNNNGVIGNTQTATLTETTLTGGARTLTETTDYTISGTEPGGLTVSITSDGVNKLTIGFASAASAHTASDGGTFDISFTDALFANVAAANITGSSETFSVSFDNAPTINYSGTVFSELANGAIDNTSPIEITLSGDAFTGGNGSDFVAAGKVTTNNVPAGLTLTLTKSSNTKLLARLIGAATANAPANDVHNLTITFENSAFAAADADQVAGYSTNTLQVLFNDSTLTINTVPYSESFESYDDGDVLGIVQGWQPHGRPVVTTETAIVSALTSDFSEFPIDTAHTKVLRMTQDTSDEIQSSSGGQLYTDCMLYMVARDDIPSGSDDYQVAFYVNSSEKLVLWHDGGSGGEWLPTDTTVTSNTWHRFTVKQDQTNKRYQLYLDGVSSPVSDAEGYADRTGATTPGSWFDMVNTNGFMSRVRVLGGDSETPTYMDDLVVVQETPEYLTSTLFLFR
jgi:hypothetical protein